jgi:hypothetical protein
VKRSLAALIAAAFLLAACVVSTPTNDLYRHVPGEADLRPALF